MAALLLDREASLAYRSGTMEVAYLAVDRPDISGTVKMLAQAMCKSREGHKPLTEIGSIPGGKKRSSLTDSNVHQDAQVHSLVDPDWAGDVRNTRSTTGMAERVTSSGLRQHLRVCIGHSQVEAEYSALVRGVRVLRIWSRVVLCRLADRVSKLTNYADSSGVRAFWKGDEGWERCVTS